MHGGKYRAENLKAPLLVRHKKKDTKNT